MARNWKLTVDELKTVSGTFQLTDNIATNLLDAARFMNVSGICSLLTTTHAVVQTNDVTIQETTMADKVKIEFGNNGYHNNLQKSACAYVWRRQQ